VKESIASRSALKEMLQENMLKKNETRWKFKSAERYEED
jgi:hypothetical protein